MTTPRPTHLDSLPFDVLRLRNHDRALEWNKDNPDGKCPDEFTMMELQGEIGEAQNVVKKLCRMMLNLQGGLNIDTGKQQLADELADVIICTDLVAMAFDIDLGESVRQKFNKTSMKHGLSVTL